MPHDFTQQPTDAELEDAKLYLPVPFVLAEQHKQQDVIDLLTKQLEASAAMMQGLEMQLAEMRKTGEDAARARDRWHTAWANHEHTITGLRQVLAGANAALEPIKEARDRLAADVLRLEAELDAAEQHIRVLQAATQHP